MRVCVCERVRALLAKVEMRDCVRMYTMWCLLFERAREDGWRRGGSHGVERFWRNGGRKEVEKRAATVDEEERNFPSSSVQLASNGSIR